MGAHFSAKPYKEFEQFFKRPLTGRGLEGCLKEWEKAREAPDGEFETAAARNPER
jgi:hypothetical protein